MSDHAFANEVRVIIACFENKEALQQAVSICSAEGGRSCVFNTLLITRLRSNSQQVYDQLDALNPLAIRWGDPQKAHVELAAF